MLAVTRLKAYCSRGGLEMTQGPAVVLTGRGVLQQKLFKRAVVLQCALLWVGTEVPGSQAGFMENLTLALDLVTGIFGQD